MKISIWTVTILLGASLALAQNAAEPSANKTECDVEVTAKNLPAAKFPMKPEGLWIWLKAVEDSNATIMIKEDGGENRSFNETWRVNNTCTLLNLEVTKTSNDKQTSVIIPGRDPNGKYLGFKTFSSVEVSSDGMILWTTCYITKHTADPAPSQPEMPLSVIDVHAHPVVSVSANNVLTQLEVLRSAIDLDTRPMMPLPLTEEPDNPANMPTRPAMPLSANNIPTQPEVPQSVIDLACRPMMPLPVTEESDYPANMPTRPAMPLSANNMPTQPEVPRSVIDLATRPMMPLPVTEEPDYPANMPSRPAMPLSANNVPTQPEVPRSVIDLTCRPVMPLRVTEEPDNSANMPTRPVVPLSANVPTQPEVPRSVIDLACRPMMPLPVTEEPDNPATHVYSEWNASFARAGRRVPSKCFSLDDREPPSSS